VRDLNIMLCSGDLETNLSELVRHSHVIQMPRVNMSFSDGPFGITVL